MKSAQHLVENPASSCRGKCRPGCSDRVRKMSARTCARTYKVGAYGYGAGAGWIATMGRASGDPGYTTRDDGYAACDDEESRPMTGTTRTTIGTKVKILHDDGYVS